MRKAIHAAYTNVWTSATAKPKFLIAEEADRMLAGEAYMVLGDDRHGNPRLKHALAIMYKKPDGFTAAEISFAIMCVYTALDSNDLKQWGVKEGMQDPPPIAE